MPKGTGSRISKEKCDAIVALLLTTRLTYRQIAEQVGDVTHNTVWRIHQEMNDNPSLPPPLAVAI